MLGIPTTHQPILGYHGCDRKIAEKLLSYEEVFKPSTKDFDWLGPGSYFWVGDPVRAAAWALEKKSRGAIEEPYVVGAYIDPGFCLNLLDPEAHKELRDAYQIYKDSVIRAATKRPDITMYANDRYRAGIATFRRLDCAVIQMVHSLRTKNNKQPFDSVYGSFDEGEPVFEGSSLREQSHAQLAVIDPRRIQHVFRLANLDELLYGDYSQTAAMATAAQEARTTVISKSGGIFQAK
jgi:hypothetical protein